MPRATVSVPGRTEVLAVGMQIPGSVLILDERLGRSFASALTLNFTGTLRILLRGKVEGRIPRIELTNEKLLKNSTLAKLGRDERFSRAGPPKLGSYSFNNTLGSIGSAPFRRTLTSGWAEIFGSPDHFEKTPDR